MEHLQSVAGNLKSCHSRLVALNWQMMSTVKTETVIKAIALLDAARIFQKWLIQHRSLMKFFFQFWHNKADVSCGMCFCFCLVIPSASPMFVYLYEQTYLTHTSSWGPDVYDEEISARSIPTRWSGQRQFVWIQAENGWCLTYTKGNFMFWCCFSFVCFISVFS